MLQLDAIYKAAHVLKEVVRRTDLIYAPQINPCLLYTSTQLDDFSVHQTDTDPEQFGINICQIRDIVGVLTVCIVLVQIVSLLGNILYFLDSYSTFHKLI